MRYHYNLRSLFKDTVTEFSDRVALRLAEKDYSYQQLDETSNALAGYLQSSSIVQGDVVAIVSTKCFEDFALMIACLKIGATYTNIDIDNPADRIKTILNVCAPKILFSKKDKLEILECAVQSKITYVNYQTISLNSSTTFKEHDIDGDSVAYIMFTSGSTGVPKGAAITHQNILHFIAWTTTRFSISPEDNFANISPMYFDNSVFDFYTALFSGASLTPISKILLTKPLELVQYIDQKACTIWFSVPSMLIFMMTMKVLRKDNLKTIRTFVFGGEGYPKKELKKLYDLYKDRVQLVNVYGPTECTCICSSYTIDDTNFDNLDELTTLGPINPNFSYVILKDGSRAQEGELCLMGPNVGKGYYNDPERTEKAFSLYTDRHHHKKSLYKTGDLVQEKGGLLFFKGRADNQIKHMGYRIELEEIEIALNALPEVRQAALIYHKGSAAYGDIVAFIEPEGLSLDISMIKKALTLKLPSYMMPTRFEVLEKFPKNANGKVDKKQLLASPTLN